MRGIYVIFCIAINPYSLINGLMTIPPYGDDPTFHQSHQVMTPPSATPAPKVSGWLRRVQLSARNVPDLVALPRTVPRRLRQHVQAGDPSNGCCPAMFGRTSMNIANKSYTVYTV